MNEWRVFRLGQVTRMSFGRTPPRGDPRFWDNGVHRWATIADLRNDPVVETAERVSNFGSVVAGRVVPKGAILMSFKLTVGRVARAGNDLRTNEAIVSVAGAEGTIEDRWLYHVLPSVAAGGITDVAVKGSTLNKKKLERLFITVPPLEEQRRIAEILDTIDETIQATERVIAKLKLDRDGARLELLGGASWKSEFQVVPLQSLLARSPKNGKSPVESERWNGVFMLGLGCLTPEGFKPDQLKYAPLVDSTLASAILNEGDVLMSRSNTRERVGLAGVYRSLDAPCIYPDLMMRLVPKPGVSGRFLEIVLGASPARRQIESMASGTSGSMVKITGRGVGRIKVPEVSTGTQSLLISILDAFNSRLDASCALLSKLHLERAGLAADLLSGRVRTVAA